MFAELSDGIYQIIIDGHSAAGHNSRSGLLIDDISIKSCFNYCKHTTTNGNFIFSETQLWLNNISHTTRNTNIVRAIKCYLRGVFVDWVFGKSVIDFDKTCCVYIAFHKIKLTHTLRAAMENVASSNDDMAGPLKKMWCFKMLPKLSKRI